MDAHFQVFGDMVEFHQLQGKPLNSLIFQWGGPDANARFLSLKLDAMHDRQQGRNGNGGKTGGKIKIKTGAVSKLSSPQGLALLALKGPGGEPLCWDNALSNTKCVGARCPRGGKHHATGALLKELKAKLEAAGIR